MARVKVTVPAPLPVIAAPIEVGEIDLSAIREHGRSVSEIRGMYNGLLVKWYGHAVAVPGGTLIYVGNVQPNEIN